MLAMLKGAVRELRVGDPADVRTDVGPVIDADALSRLHAHVEAMRSAGMAIEAGMVPDALAAGHFMAPTLIELDRLSRLEGEVFGPVLHVIRFNARELPGLVDQINATGFGLTLGVHSRIEARIQAVVSRARVGNIYVNRNMVGAVVGVQPFGGEGCSGTGPKAGGPLYLTRLMRHALPSVTPDAAPDRTALDAFEAWLASGDLAHVSPGARHALIGMVARYSSQSPVGADVRLDGPTGEENRWRVLPRGCIGGISGSERGLLHQLAAALATGNRLAIEDVPMARSVFAGAPSRVAERLIWVRKVVDAAPAVVLFDGPAAAADAMRTTLADLPGPLVPLSVPAPHYDLSRLVVERTISTNTAAAGGNARLMSLGD